ncbi:hypothetical protein DEO72_LG3g1067 [Vigna unguiculata]|uniref:Uncharacterized protein n=1 Tax=Vigna unguiculata TaxID=3917 RepID=A0A4D6LE45_VIGUN|nr:hypothetical protein DEO72_LG3g1067 [Vigna unguiculata]
MRGGRESEGSRCCCRCGGEKMETTAEVGCDCHGWNKLHARGEDELAVDSKLQGSAARRDGRKRWKSKLGMECDAVVVAEHSREEENGVAMVALRSCDGGAAEKVRRV